MDCNEILKEYKLSKTEIAPYYFPKYTANGAVAVFSKMFSKSSEKKIDGFKLLVCIDTYLRQKLVDYQRALDANNKRLAAMQSVEERKESVLKALKEKVVVTFKFKDYNLKVENVSENGKVFLRLQKHIKGILSSTSYLQDERAEDALTIFTSDKGVEITYGLNLSSETE